jgi:phage FluMu protein Com
MEITISGIKCDNITCNYRNDSVKFSEYPIYINAKCPKCSEVLLTKKCYDQCVQQYKTVSRINFILNVLKWFNPFHYIRLIFGDKRKRYSLTKKF